MLFDAGGLDLVLFAESEDVVADDIFRRPLDEVNLLFAAFDKISFDDVIAAPRPFHINPHLRAADLKSFYHDVTVIQCDGCDCG